MRRATSSVILSPSASASCGQHSNHQWQGHESACVAPPSAKRLSTLGRQSQTAASNGLLLSRQHTAESNMTAAASDATAWPASHQAARTHLAHELHDFVEVVLLLQDLAGRLARVDELGVEGVVEGLQRLGVPAGWGGTGGTGCGGRAGCAGRRHSQSLVAACRREMGKPAPVTLRGGWGGLPVSAGAKSQLCWSQRGRSSGNFSRLGSCRAGNPSLGV